MKKNAESQEALSNAKVNWLIYGDPATGKTHTAFTGRQPVYCQSFDPQGSDIPHLHDMVRKGTAIIDRTCEVEDAERPSAFVNFNKNFMAMQKAGAFDHIGTYVIDSLTFLSDAILNFVLQQEGRAGTHPQIQDYSRVKATIKKVMLACCNLPCDFVLTGHIQTEKDEVNLTTITSLMTIGKNSIIIPQYFSEFLVTDVLQKGDTISYRLLTKPHKRYRARTRIGSGTFLDYETPDLMYLRKKAGFEASHLPPLPTEENP